MDNTWRTFHLHLSRFSFLPADKISCLQDFLHYLLTPTRVAPITTTRNKHLFIGSLFDTLSATVQKEILSTIQKRRFLFDASQLTVFLSSIQPSNPLVQELVHGMQDQQRWEAVDHCWVGENVANNNDNDDLVEDVFLPPENTVDLPSQESFVKQPSVHKRKRKEDPWQPIIKTLKVDGSSFNVSKQLDELFNSMPLDFLIERWNHRCLSSISSSVSKEEQAMDSTLLYHIGKEVLSRGCMNKDNEQFTYSIDYPVAILRHFFLPYVRRLKVGVNRQLFLLFLEWAKTWPLLIQQHFLLPLLLQEESIQSPQVELIRRIGESCFTRDLLTDTMRKWLFYGEMPWNDSILVVLEEWLSRVDDKEIIKLFLTKVEQNAPFVELHPKWIKLLYDVCQQHLWIGSSYRQILASCLVTTSSYLTERTIALLQQKSGK